MGWTDSGYGIVVDEARWCDDAADTLYSWVLAQGDGSRLLERAREYAADFDDDEWADERRMFADFISDYENEEMTASGIEAAIVDFMNERVFGGQDVFRYDDYAIYVAAYIPYDDTDKDNHPTQVQIEDILATWLNPLLETPLEVGWHDISFY